MQLFLSGNPDLSILKSKEISFARIQGMNKQEVKAYFDLLEKV